MDWYQGLAERVLWRVVDGVFFGEVDKILVFGFSDFIGMVQLLWAISSIFVTGKELLAEKGVQIVCGVWAGIEGREERLWTGGGQADSSGGVRGKALWGNFEAEIFFKFLLDSNQE